MQSKKEHEKIKAREARVLPLSSHRSPLSELLEQAKRASKTDVEGLNVINDP